MVEFLFTFQFLGEEQGFKKIQRNFRNLFVDVDLSILNNRVLVFYAINFSWILCMIAHHSPAYLSVHN